MTSPLPHIATPNEGAPGPSQLGTGETQTRPHRVVLIHAHMIRPGRSARRRIRRRIDPRKCTKLIRKMRLILEPAIHRQLRPPHVSPRMQPLHRQLKPLHPAPHFGRKPHLLAEDLRESPFAPAGGPRNIGHRRQPGRSTEASQRKLHRAVQANRSLGKHHVEPV